MDSSIYHHDSENGYETYYDGNGGELSGLGDTVPVAAPSATASPPGATPTWWENLIGAAGQIGTQVANVKAAQQIAKTGQVPTAQVNVGVSGDVQKLLIYGGVALGGLLLLSMLSRRGKRR